MLKLAVVGLGYVGLPVVEAAVRSGLDVVGVDVDTRVVTDLAAGRSHIDDLSDEVLAELLQLGFKPTSDFSALASADATIICVPTPLAPSGGPDLTAVIGAATATARHLRPGSLVVLESTTYPGTTAEVVTPLLEAGSGMTAHEDFLVAYSPERIDPGNENYGFRNTPKVVGADSKASLDAVTSLYAQIVDSVVQAKGTREAEAAKLLENTYRHVNIALVNELAQLFFELEIDVWDVIDLAATKPFGFQAFRPGPGVGGHCIPIDPNYLAHQVRTQLGRSFRLIELAQEINNSMPAYVASRVMLLLNERAKSVRGSRVLLLGVTYKANIADQRESPARAVAEALATMGAELSYHDPYVEDWIPTAVRVLDGSLEMAVRDADIVVLLQHHDCYDVSHLESEAALMLDTRGASTLPSTAKL